MRRISNHLILGFALVSLSGCAERVAVNLILHNGKIVTVDDAFSIQQAVAVRDGRIVAVGGNELLARYHTTPRGRSIWRVRRSSLDSTTCTSTSAETPSAKST